MTECMQQQIDEWLVAHGGARRFAPADSTGYFTVQRFLLDRQYLLSASAGQYVVRRIGRKPRRMSWAKVLQLVDTLRIAEGLEPFAPILAASKQCAA